MLKMQRNDAYMLGQRCNQGHPGLQGGLKCHTVPVNMDNYCVHKKICMFKERKDSGV